MVMQLVMALVTFATTTSCSSDPKLLDGAGDVVWRARYIDRIVTHYSIPDSATTAAIESIDGRITTVYTRREGGGLKLGITALIQRWMVNLPGAPYVGYGPGGTSSSAWKHCELSFTTITCGKRKIVWKKPTVIGKEKFVFWRGQFVRLSVRGDHPHTH